MANGTTPFSGTEYGTFSAAVDDCITRSGRPDRKAEIIGFARRSIRECQVYKGQHFERDFVEDQIIATSDPFIWNRPAIIRQLRTVSYPDILDGYDEQVYPRYMLPGRAQRKLRFFYYAGTTYYVFAGPGIGLNGTNINARINIGYYRYLPPLPYYDAANRPARFSLETSEWWYADETLDAEEQEAAREQVTNWLLFDWYDTIVEGALAKLFKTYGDDRQRPTFALYKSYQSDILLAEPIAAMAGEI